MKLTTESPIADIIARFKQLTGSNADDKTLAKRGKAKLLATIEDLEANLDDGPAPTEEGEPDLSIGVDPEPQAEAAEESPAPKKPKKAKAPKEKKKKKGPIIRAEAEKLLLKVVSYDEEKRPFGMPYEDILVELAKIFPGAKTTVACLRWYAVHMRERGEKVPARPRATPAKADTKAA